jgi:hypothetical protein
MKLRFLFRLWASRPLVEAGSQPIVVRRHPDLFGRLADFGALRRAPPHRLPARQRLLDAVSDGSNPREAVHLHYPGK